MKSSFGTEPTDSGKKSEYLGRVRIDNLNRAAIKPEEIAAIRRELQEDNGDFTNCNNPYRHQH